MTTIEECVAKCRAIVSVVNASDLMNRCYWRLLRARLNAPAEESKAGVDSLRASFTLTYLHKLIAGCGNPDASATPPSEEQFDELFDNTFQILRLLGFAAKDRHARNLTQRERMLAIQQQIFWPVVTGERYAFFEIQHLKDFVTPHSDALKRLFGLTADGVVAGITRLQAALMRGPIEALENIRDYWKEWQAAVDSSDEAAQAKIITEAQTHAKNPFSSEFFDVQQVTGWPDKFVQAMSLKPGEDTSFCAEGEASGWPTRATLTSIKPFLRLGERSFIYFHHLLLDDFYPALRAALLTAEPNYRDRWNSYQALAAEIIGIGLFERLLPGSKIYKNVHYQFQHQELGTTEWTECDAVCIFDKSLFVIEVKAGAYTPKPPSKSFQPHLDSIENLLIAPVRQGYRLLEILEERHAVDLFDEKHHKPITSLERDDFEDVCVVAITLDQLTEIAPKLESILQARKLIGAGELWAVSIDDLRVFAEIVTNPLIFLHYLGIRRTAYLLSALDTDDELDHLGAYFKHNEYVERLRQNASARLGGVILNGYRDDFDRYFQAKLLGEDADRPKQKMPQVLEQIIECLATSKDPLRVNVAMSLLSLGERLRNQLAKSVESTREQQALLSRALPTSIVGTHPFTFYVNSYGVAASSDEKRLYAHALMRSRGEINRTVLTIGYKDSKIIDLTIESLDVNQAEGIDPLRLQKSMKSLQKIKWASTLGRHRS